MNTYLKSMLCLVLTMSFAAHSGAQLNGDSPPRIFVQGSAEVEADPDYIEWTITLTDEDPSALEAKKMNDARYQAVLEIADDLDIERDDAIAGLVSLNKTYHEDERGRRTGFKGYRVYRSVTLIQRDMEEFDKMLEELVEAQAEFNVQFGSSKIQEMKKKARQLAVRNAKEKAQAMAGELNQRIGRPLVIEEDGASSGFDLRDAISNSSYSTRQGGDRVGVRRGAISVRCSVRVEFTLIDG